ncbi:hypothetical protein SDC9_83278 [bioreactor metagenome]|uniref:Uncharacterized protein n=1 Tax=bioreactor metagenome TaxID=1076179 RepID=A0A644Z8R2_9ZZZZ
MQKMQSTLSAGFLESAKACERVAADLERLAAKYGRAAEKEKAKRRAELESLAIYSEVDVQNLYGYAEITQSQYERYLDMLHEGEAALENRPATVNELAQKMLFGFRKELLAERDELKLLALTPEARRAELARREATLRNWQARIKKLKEEMEHGKDTHSGL